MGVAGMYGVYVGFKSLRNFAQTHPKNISNMYVKVYSRKLKTSLQFLFLWEAKILLPDFWLYGIAVRL